MGKGERDKNEVEIGINLIKQHLTCLMKRLNFILNVLGETAFSTDARPGLMSAIRTGKGEHLLCMYLYIQSYM